MKAILRACRTFVVYQRLKRLQNETTTTSTTTKTAKTYANTDSATSVTNKKSPTSSKSSPLPSPSPSLLLPVVWWWSSNRIILVIYLLLFYSLNATTAANIFRNNTTDIGNSNSNSISSDYNASHWAKQQQQQQYLQHTPSAVTFRHKRIHQQLENTLALNTQLNNNSSAKAKSSSATLASKKEILNRRPKKNEFVSRNEVTFSTTQPSLADPITNPPSWLSPAVYVAVSTSTSSTSLLFTDSSTTESPSYGESSTVFNDTVGHEDSEIPEIPSYIRTTAMCFCIIIMIMGVIGNVMVSWNFYFFLFFFFLMTFAQQRNWFTNATTLCKCETLENIFRLFFFFLKFCCSFLLRTTVND